MKRFECKPNGFHIKSTFAGFIFFVTQKKTKRLVVFQKTSNEPTRMTTRRTTTTTTRRRRREQFSSPFESFEQDKHITSMKTFNDTLVHRRHTNNKNVKERERANLTTPVQIAPQDRRQDKHTGVKKKVIQQNKQGLFCMKGLK